VDKATKDAEYDLLKRLAGFEKQLGRISRAKVETYLEMVHIYVWRAAEFKSDARGAALIKAQSMLFLGAGNLETQDDPTNALRLYAAAEAVAAIANTVVTDGTYKKLIAKNNQDIGKLKQGLLAGRLRNISRKPLQGVYDRGFKKIYRIYRHEENPVK
jgi:hypothetical protein